MGAVVAWVVGVLAAAGTVFVLGMRGKWAIVMTPIKRLNKRFSNPRQMRTAGTPGAYAGIIRHVGRVSGTAYETPIGITEVDGGFAVTLPYGTGPDWLKNVLAAGRAELVHEGRTYEVDDPRLVHGDEALALFPDEHATLKLFNVRDALVLHRVDAAPGPGVEPAP